MLALRSTSRLSPLWNTAMTRYKTRSTDRSWDIYYGGMYKRPLLLGESLGVQAFDVYRNFFLYHSIAPYTIPALRYYCDPNYPQESLVSVDKCLFGALGFIWDVGTWFFKCARRIVEICLPTFPFAGYKSIDGQKMNKDNVIEDIVSN